MYKCPLCCGEEFADVGLLRAHVLCLAQKLKCPSCNTRFDNLMVMAKHLERGCRSQGSPGAKSVTKKEINNTLDSNEDNEGAQDEADATVEPEDDSEQESSISNVVKEEFLKFNKESTSQSVAEEQTYTDEEGQTYNRRVIKISNIWKELEKEKMDESTSNELVTSTPKGASDSTVCPICHINLRTPLTVHMELAHKSQIYRCVRCSRGYATQNALDLHVAESHATPFTCIYCNKPFSSLDRAKRHIDNHKKQNIKKGKHKCELCPVMVNSDNDLKRHYRDEHLEELQPKKRPIPIAPYKKGSSWYEWDGHTYHLVARLRTDTQVLKCWVEGCWAEVRVPVIGQVTTQGEHSHIPYDWVKERNEMFNSLRHRCETETTPIRIIYDEEALRYPEAAQRLPFPEATMRKWQRPLKEMIESMEVDESSMDINGTPTNRELLAMLPGSIMVKSKKRSAED